MRSLAPAVLVGLVAAGGSAAGPASRTIGDGVYTAEQADRGKQFYRRSCAACHPLDWYRGDVMKAWEGASLSELYDLIATLMPPENPSSLKRRQYADILAYILSLNGLPVGATELSDKPEALKEIRIQWRKKP